MTRRRGFNVRLVSVLGVAPMLLGPSVFLIYACSGQNLPGTIDKVDTTVAQPNPGADGIATDQTVPGDEQGKVPVNRHAMRPKHLTRAQLIAAAERSKLTAPQSVAAPAPGGIPNYYGPDANWAFSPVIPKFVDALPGLGAPGCNPASTCNANGLGQYVPIAAPDTTSFPGSDYYEIAVKDYAEKMHSNLPVTKLRGYVQLNKGTDASGANTILPAPIHYLGPLIVSKENRPVRIKFVNQIGLGNVGNLFVPVDPTVMGAGMGPDGMTMYKQNRATLHLHGGENPWISDGTPHQWTVPAGESTPYPRGVSTQFVPDMWFDASTHALVPKGTANATNDPGPGAMTFYWPNTQGSRLQFYHDHAYGITRLNVYAGEAAGYLITDSTEGTLVAGGTLNGVAVPAGTLPADQVPLVIQDKTFVDTATVMQTDPTWNWGSNPGTPVAGDLWFPHVYMPFQNPNDPLGINPFGRWDYGPFVTPPFDAAAGLQNPPIIGTGANGCPAGIICPNVPNPSYTSEAFMDTPVINGTAYPTATLLPKAYRFRILNACNDRHVNLGFYYAEPLSMVVTNAGSGYTAPTVAVSAPPAGGTQATAIAWVDGVITTLSLSSGGSGYSPNPTVTFVGGGGSYASASAIVIGGVIKGLALANPGTGFTSAPAVSITDLTGTGASATATIARVVGGINVTNPGSGYVTPPTITINDPTGTGATAASSFFTEVKVIPAVASPVFPAYWPTMDNRFGGVPDPATAGPAIIQVGTEGGLLPQPAVIPSTPIGFDLDPNSPTYTNVKEHGLLMAPAERADMVVDFSAVPPGSKLILYNDAPAPLPGGDSRLDYFSGNGDQTSIGGGPGTLPGFGPNTRTLMQITIAGTPSAAYSLANIQKALPAAHFVSQPPAVVPEPQFSAAEGKVYKPAYANLMDSALSFTPVGNTAVNTVKLASGGGGYTTPPTVVFTGTGTGAAATASITGSVWTVKVVAGGQNYLTGTTTISFFGGGGSGVAASPVISGGIITAVNITNPGTGYSTPPTVVIKGAGTGAIATASIAGPVTGIQLTNGGSGYLSAPAVSFTGGGGSGAVALASMSVTKSFNLKTVAGSWEPTYGRMIVTMGVELPFSGYSDQMSIPQGYADLPTDIFKVGETQYWKITHRDVDTHVLHFHLINVQIINRVDWAGNVKPPEANEAGWKESVRVNPGEDVIVAFKAKVPTVPFPLPDSYRSPEPTMPATATLQGLDPATGQPYTYSNAVINYLNEYVWHCHILGHEEMDMMRPMLLTVAPNLPTILPATVPAMGVNPPNVTVAWMNNAIDPAATTFTVQRAGDAAFTVNPVTFPSVPVSQLSMVDTTTATHANYYYRVKADNPNASSAPSDPVNIVTPGQLPQAPTGLAVTGTTRTAITIGWTNGSTAAPNAPRTGLRVEYHIGAFPFPWIAAATLPANATSYTISPLLYSVIYSVRVVSVNADGSSASTVLTKTCGK